MQTHTFDLDTADGPMPCYEAVPDRPNDPPRGAVVVIQEAFGVNPHIEDVTRRFADAGYHAVAPHLFHRTGSPTFSYDDYSKLGEHFMALTDPGILADVDAVIDHLHQAGWTDGQIGTVGFCMGGRATFLVAGNRTLGAAVGFYGGAIVTGPAGGTGSLLHLAPTLHTPWLGLFGDADQHIPVDDVERLRTELESAPVDTEIVRYAGADHGFHCDARPSYHPEAAADGWVRTLSWLDAHLAKAG